MSKVKEKKKNLFDQYCMRHHSAIVNRLEVPQKSLYWMMQFNHAKHIIPRWRWHFYFLKLHLRVIFVYCTSGPMFLQNVNETDNMIYSFASLVKNNTVCVFSTLCEISLIPGGSPATFPHFLNSLRNVITAYPLLSTLFKFEMSIVRNVLTKCVQSSLGNSALFA